MSFHLRRGTTSMLATLVSAPLERLESALARLAEDLGEGGPLVGIHLEGPFLSEEKCGAHSRENLCDPTPERVDRLLAKAGSGLRMVTLAPERDGALDATARFHRAGAVVSAGHSRATRSQLRDAIDQGLSFMTHVGNASDWPDRPYDPERGYRRSEPGMVGTFLCDPELRGSVIMDGHHLHPELVRALVELRGPGSVALISDATPAAGLAPGRYQLGGLDAEIHAGGYATAGGGLAGSVIPLVSAVREAVCSATLSLADAVRMATVTPADVIGLEARQGPNRARLRCGPAGARRRSAPRAGLPGWRARLRRLILESQPFPRQVRLAWSRWLSQPQRRPGREEPMLRFARTLTVSLALIAVLGFSPGAAQAGMNDSFETCDYPKTFDLIVLRPVSLLALAIGTGLFVGVAPFAYVTVKKDFRSVTESLVYKPARFTFKRRLGECAGTTDF